MAEATRFLPEPTSLPKAAATLVAVTTGTSPWEMHLLVPVTNASTTPLAGTTATDQHTAAPGTAVDLLAVPTTVTATPTLVLPPTKPAVPAVAAKALAVPLLRLLRQHLWLLPRPMRGESHRVARRRVPNRSQPPILHVPRNPRTAVPLTATVLAASARATAPANKQIAIDLMEKNE